MVFVGVIFFPKNKDRNPRQVGTGATHNMARATGAMWSRDGVHGDVLHKNHLFDGEPKRRQLPRTASLSSETIVANVAFAVTRNQVQQLQRKLPIPPSLGSNYVDARNVRECRLCRMCMSVPYASYVYVNAVYIDLSFSSNYKAS